jgi:hypothetical protein
MKTRKLIIPAILAAMLISVSVDAQISVGTRHGVTFSTLSKTGDLYDNVQIITSYTGGVFITIPVGGAIDFLPEVNFIRKGRSSEELNSLGEEFSSHYDYIQVPLMARYNTTLSGNSKYSIYFNAGPYASALLKSQRKLISSKDWENDEYGNVDKDPDFGIIVGGGVTIPINKFRMQFDLRYDLGLSKLNNQPDDYRTKALSLTAGIIF